MFHRIRNRWGYLPVAVLGSVAAFLVLASPLASPRTAYELDKVMAQVRGALQLGDAKAGRRYCQLERDCALEGQSRDSQTRYFRSFATLSGVFRSENRSS